MKVQSDCDQSHSPISSEHYSCSTRIMKAQEEEEEERTPKAHENNEKSKYDSMEESLRNALRQSGRQLPPKEGKSQVCENTITKHHNYITVYEHDQLQLEEHLKLLNKENNSQQSVSHQSPTVVGTREVPSSLESKQTSGHMSTEEFRSYCALLTERVHKMEEQNRHLLQIAEIQKAEYNKVAALVAQSEQNQRHLQVECVNLKRQVQQLASHNKILREQQVDYSNLNSPVVPAAGFQGLPGSFFQEDRKNHFNSEISKYSAEGIHHLGREVNHTQQQNSVASEYLRSYTASDVTAIVELYSKLQNSTQIDNKPNFHSQSVPSEKIQQNYTTTHGYHACAPHITHDPVQSRRTSFGQVVSGALSSRESVQPPVLPPHLQRQTIAAPCSYSKMETRSYDNNSYVEVELLNYHESKGSTENYRFHPTASTAPLPLSPLSPLDDSEVFLHHNGNITSNNNTTALQRHHSVDSTKQINRRSVREQFSDESRSMVNIALPVLSNPKRNDIFNGSAILTNTSSQKISSTSDLGSSLNITSENVVEDFGRDIIKQPQDYYGRTRSNSAAAIAYASCNRITTEEKEELDPKTSEGISPNLRRQQSDFNLHSKENVLSFERQQSVGGRRGSYTAACRKSQSMDLLCEIALLGKEKDENVSRDDIFDDEDSVCASGIGTLQFDQNNSVPSPLSIDSTPSSDLKETLIASSHTSREIMEEDVASSSSNGVFPDTKSVNTSYPVTSFLNSGEISSKEQTSTKTKNLRYISQTPTSTKDHLSPGEQHKISSSTEASPHQSARTTQDSCTHHATTDARSLSLSDDILLEENIVKSSVRRPRVRISSEGSTGRSRKENFQIDSTNDQLRKQRFLGSDMVINKHKEEVVSPYSTDLISSPDRSGPPSSSGRKLRQPRFPSTNPHVRLQHSANKMKKQNNSEGDVELENQQKVLDRLSSSQGKNTCDSPSSQQSLSTSNNIKQNVIGKLQEQKIGTKFMNKDKKTVGQGVLNKKKAFSANSGQTKSLMNIMKAKFSRSSSASRFGTTAKAPRAPDPFEIKPINPVTLSFDPKALASDPNSYLPPCTDDILSGNNNPRQLLKDSKNTVVTPKLSQNFANEISDASSNEVQIQQDELAEDALSDEGFAEGSTIERAEKQIQSENTSDSLSTFQDISLPRYVDVKPDETNQKVSQKEEETSSVQRLENWNAVKKESNNWRGSAISLNSQKIEKRMNLEARHFRILKSSPEFDRRSERQDSARQKSTKIKLGRESSCDSLLSELKSNRSKTAINNNKRLIEKGKTNVVENRQTGVPGREPLSTEVTIIRTSPSNLNHKESLIFQRSKTKSPLKFTKSASGGALGKIMQSVNNHYSGSKEDLSGKFDNGKGKESNKSRLSDHQNIFEKAYISSVVQAELSQNLSQRNSFAESLRNEHSRSSTPSHLPSNLNSHVGDSVATGSVGTGSSFGSLPSDFAVSNNSVDGMEFEGSQSPTFNDSSIPLQTQQVCNGKRGGSTSFGFAGNAGKTGTGGSSSSSSSSEINHRGNSKLSASGDPRLPSRSPPTLANENAPIRPESASGHQSDRRSASADPRSFNHPKTVTNRDLQAPGIVKPNTGRNEPVQRQQFSPRISKMPGPSKLPSSGKSIATSGRKGSDGYSPILGMSQPNKVKLAPLGYGVASINKSNGQNSRGTISVPIANKASMIQQCNEPILSKGTATPAHHIPVPQRQPLPAYGIPLPKHSTGCGSGQMEVRRQKKSIPVSGMLHRPRPIYSRVGAG